MYDVDSRAHIIMPENVKSFRIYQITINITMQCLKVLTLTLYIKRKQKTILSTVLRHISMIAENILRVKRRLNSCDKSVNPSDCFQMDSSIVI